MPKFEKKTEPNYKNALERWLLFIDNPTQEVLELIKEKDPAIEKAKTVLDYLANDEETMYLYELREKAVHDEVTRMYGAREEGKKEEKVDMVKKMLLEKIEMDIILKISGLTRQEVEKIEEMQCNKR